MSPCLVFLASSESYSRRKAFIHNCFDGLVTCRPYINDNHASVWLTDNLLKGLDIYVCALI